MTDNPTECQHADKRLLDFDIYECYHCKTMFSYVISSSNIQVAKYGLYRFVPLD